MTWRGHLQGSLPAPSIIYILFLLAACLTHAIPAPLNDPLDEEEAPHIPTTASPNTTDQLATGTLSVEEAGVPTLETLALQTSKSPNPTDIGILDVTSSSNLSDSHNSSEATTDEILREWPDPGSTVPPGLVSRSLEDLDGGSEGGLDAGSQTMPDGDVEENIADPRCSALCMINCTSNKVSEINTTFLSVNKVEISCRAIKMMTYYL